MLEIKSYSVEFLGLSDWGYVSEIFHHLGRAIDCQDLESKKTDRVSQESNIDFYLM